MRTGMNYRCDCTLISMRIGKNSVPLALAGSGGPQATPPYAGRGRPPTMVVAEADVFVFSAVRAQPIESGPGANLVQVERMMAWLPDALSTHIRSCGGAHNLAGWLQAHGLEGTRQVFAFRLMPTHSVYDEIEGHFRTDVLGRSPDSLKRLEPPNVWARELFVFEMYPMRYLKGRAA